MWRAIRPATYFFIPMSDGLIVFLIIFHVIWAIAGGIATATKLDDNPKFASKYNLKQKFLIKVVGGPAVWIITIIYQTFLGIHWTFMAIFNSLADKPKEQKKTLATKTLVESAAERLEKKYGRKTAVK